MPTNNPHVDTLPLTDRQKDIFSRAIAWASAHAMAFSVELERFEKECSASPKYRGGRNIGRVMHLKDLVGTIRMPLAAGKVNALSEARRIAALAAALTWNDDLKQYGGLGVWQWESKGNWMRALFADSPHEMKRMDQAGKAKDFYYGRRDVLFVFGGGHILTLDASLRK